MTTLSRPSNALPGVRGLRDAPSPDKSAPDSGRSSDTTRSVSDPTGGKSGRRKRAIYYPTGDGKPMAEDNLHRKLMAYCCDALETRFAARPDVYVSGNDFLYYEEGNPKARVSPDCYVAIGVEPKARRRFYKIWEENGISPAVVIELTSKKTKKEDTTVKQPLYEQTLRVAEYFQFDPTGDYLKPRLQGQRLRAGRYEPIPLQDNRMVSEQLRLELVIEGETLRFYDPVQKEWLRSYDESEAQRVAEVQRANAAGERAEAEAQRAEAEAQRAEAETRRAEEETRRAEAEAQRAETAEAELNRLRAELDALRRKSETG